MFKQGSASLLVLSCLGAFLVPAGFYYQGHVTESVFHTGMFWASAVVAGLIPLGTFFAGLVQRPPWDPPTPVPPAGKA